MSRAADISRRNQTLDKDEALAEVQAIAVAIATHDDAGAELRARLADAMRRARAHASLAEIAERARLSRERVRQVTT